MRHSPTDFGGKRRVARLIWKRLGNPPVYCEPFAGSLAVLLARPDQPRTENANDLDGLVCNVWRAIAADPEAVAQHSDWITSELCLTSRHLRLVNEGRKIVERLTWDPDFYDARLAGWWIYGAVNWIGSGWCEGNGPHRRPDEPESGALRQTPAIQQKGVNRQAPRGGRGERVGVNRQLPNLTSFGAGVMRKVPRGSGVGVNRSEGPERFSGAGVCEARRAFILEWMDRLRDRLRHVRLTCGDWTRCVTPAVTTQMGQTAIYLDPPYGQAEHCGNIYATESECAQDVAKWCWENGENPLLRLALSGYDGEHSPPEGWTTVRWATPGGYGNQGTGRGKENAKREVIHFSPFCIRPGLGGLFGDVEDAPEEDLENDADDDPAPL